MPSQERNLERVPFGRRTRDTHFSLAPSYNALNHGSFGTYPNVVRERLHEVQAMSELRPDYFVRYETPKLLDASRAAIADFIKAPVDEVVLVPNASTATNVVLRSLIFKPGDVLVFSSTAYGAGQKTVEYLKESTPVEGAIVDLVYPLPDEEVVSAFQNTVRSIKGDGKRVKAVLFDTISSLPGVRQPWEKLVKLCHDEDVLSIVDAAHSVGQIAVDLNSVQPDFFASNLHK